MPVQHAQHEGPGRREEVRQWLRRGRRGMRLRRGRGQRDTLICFALLVVGTSTRTVMNIDT